jgi:hypothetical protein
MRLDDGCAIDVAIDGRPVGTAAVPNTGSYQSFAMAELPSVALTTGPHLVTLTFTGGFNLDFFSW